MIAAHKLVATPFGLGGVIATFGLVLDLIAFVLSLFFVVASSVIVSERRSSATR
jgi:hypothetical protein